VEREHLSGLRCRGDVELAALCGRDPRRLAEVAARHGVARTFTDWRALCAGGGLDVLVIATPNALHHPVAMAALEAGLHVVCEKPLALDAAQAREMAARAEALARHTLTFFTHRAVGAAARVKRLLDQGFLGRPVHASAAYLTASHLRVPKPLSWRMVRSQAGSGVLADLGSHLVDLVRWWLGDLERVAADWQILTREREGGLADADEDVSFLARLRSGAQASFHASKLAPGRGNHQRVELYGTGGALVYQADPGVDPTWEGQLWAGRPDGSRLEPVKLPGELAAGLDEGERAGRNEAYRRLTDPFFAAVRGEGPARVGPDFADGAAVQAVLDAVARAAETEAWVEVG
jgi:predicted dehydrogenase